MQIEPATAPMSIPDLCKAADVRQIDIAAAAGVSQAAVAQWRAVPVTRVLVVERAFGISRNVLRPDIYGPADAP